MSNIVLIAIAVAVVIIAKLALVAWHLWRKVWVQQEEQKVADQESRQKHIESQNYIKESIRVICQTLINGEMNISEGAIRLKVLADNLDNLDNSNSEPVQFNSIESLYKLVSNLDTHDARKSLSKKERMKQDLKREKAESEYQDLFMDDVKSLLALVRDQ